jgi:hypothetical protein
MPQDLEFEIPSRSGTTRTTTRPSDTTFNGYATTGCSPTRSGSLGATRAFPPALRPSPPPRPGSAPARHVLDRNLRET